MTHEQLVDGTAPHDLEEPPKTVAALLAEMDSRMQSLQQELTDTSLPIARLSPRARAVARRRRGQSAATEGWGESTRTRDLDGDAQGLLSEPFGADVSPRSPIVAALVHDAIGEADHEASQLIEDTRQRLIEIAQRARTRLEQALAEPTGAPELERMTHRERAERVAERAYEGNVTLELGPLAQLEQVTQLAAALQSIFAVEDAELVSYREAYAAFALQLSRPTLLFVELQARWADTLQVTADDGGLRLEIVGNGR